MMMIYHSIWCFICAIVANPCENGGTLTNVENGLFLCNCSPGFSGENCTVNIDDCLSNPCANGGTCFDDVSTFSCLCAPGYTGDICSVECTPTLCPNKASYLYGPGEHILLCFGLIFFLFGMQLDYKYIFLPQFLLVQRVRILPCHVVCMTVYD